MSVGSQERHLIPSLERESGPNHRVVHRARRYAEELRQEELKRHASPKPDPSGPLVSRWPVGTWLEARGHESRLGTPQATLTDLSKPLPRSR